MESLFEDGKQLQPWWRGRKWSFWLTVFSPLLVMGGCGLLWLQGKRTAAEADREAAVFHQRFAAGQYDAIYDSAAPDFQRSTDRPNSAKYFTAIHTKMGECQMPAGSRGFFTNVNPSGTTVRLQYRLQCANGSLDETLVYLSSDAGTRLAGYTANSPVLVMK